MKLITLKNMFCSTSLIAMLICTMTTQQASAGGTAYVEFEVKYSELFPEQSAHISRQLESEKQMYENAIQQAQQQGDYQRANQLIAQARERMNQLMQTIRTNCPKTKIVMHSTATREDYEQALRDLKAGRQQIGGKITLRGTSSNTTTTIPLKPAPNYPVRKRPVTSPVSQPRPQAQPHPLPQPRPQTQPQTPQDPNSPSFSGLNQSSGGGSMPSAQNGFNIGNSGLFGSNNW